MPFFGSKKGDPEVRRYLGGLGIHPRQLDIFETALTHRSYLNEVGTAMPDNQRLEYLGDSVLGFVINEHLYVTYQDAQEGELARMKSALVSEGSLAEVARLIELGSVIRLGRGAREGGGRQSASILADAFEALVGALYLDKGMDSVRKFLVDLFADRIRNMQAAGADRDPKSALQELTQSQAHVTPVYEIVSETGPDHKKTFEVRVLVNGKELGRGAGASRKKSELAAAASALSRIQRESGSGGVEAPRRARKGTPGSLIKKTRPVKRRTRPGASPGRGKSS